jgi:hypothetical protein
MQRREAAIKRETDELRGLLSANTDLTRQDKELTEQLERLVREIVAHTGSEGSSAGIRSTAALPAAT